MKRALKIAVGCLLVLLVGLALLGLATPDHLGLPAGTDGQMVSVDGVNIHYLQKGSGRDVLLIHGTPSSLEDWQPVFDRWASKYRITAYDRPGHGFSDPPAKESGIDYNAHIARRLMEELHLHDVLVVAHSYGGPIALKLAADDNSDATSFLIVGSTVYPVDEPDAAFGKLLRLPLVGRGVAVALGALVGGSMVRKRLEEAFHPDERLLPPGYIERRQALLLRPKVTLTLAQEMHTHAGQLGALVPRYPSIRRPVSVVVGSEDKARVTEGGYRLASEIPGAQFTVFPHAGHMLQFTRPDELTALLDATVATPAR